MNLTHPFLDEDGDKLREECGVFGAVNATDASAVTALGLHALQHRGQEAAGITSFNGTEFFTLRGLGHVADNFSSQEAIAELPGMMAAGHVRYSTTGGSGLRNIQPLYADLASGGFAVAHNGNISNAGMLREDLVRRGSIFQSTSDTEVIIHLVATSRYPTIMDRLIDALRLLEGAYALIVMTPEGMIACRDPLGIRPLQMGRIGDATLFASETVAFDVVGPPQCPRRQRNVSDWSVEPNVEHLALESCPRHGRPPRQVAGDASRAETVPRPAPCDGQGVGRPPALRRIRLGESLDGGVPGAQRGLRPRQVEMDVTGGPEAGHGPGETALGFEQLRRVEHRSAGVALVAPRVFIEAPRARACDVAVGQKLVQAGRPQLLVLLLAEEAEAAQPTKHALGDARLPPRGGPTKHVEIAPQPLVHAAMHGMKAVADGRRGGLLLERFRLGGGAVLVGATHKKRRVALTAEESGADVGAEDASDKVAEVWHVVDVW